MTEPFQELINVLQQRKKTAGAGSYTAQLLAAGEDEIVKKIGEEAIEVIIAAKSQGDERLLEETADLIYHISVLLVARDLTWTDVSAVLTHRSG
jgi:phosphoribosyl-ATP pyrophosphohydrolase